MEVSSTASEHVLVGVDGSPDAQAALRWGAALAAAMGARLHVAHAWQHGTPPGLGPLGPYTSTAEVEQEVRDRLGHLVDAELGEGARGDVGLHALRGPVADALCRTADDLGSTLIVVGPRGSGFAARALLGSTSQQLTQCPRHAVAVVPHAGVAEPLAAGPVVVGIDGSDGAARALRWAVDVAERAGFDLVVVHAFQPVVPDVAPEELESLAREARWQLEEQWSAPVRARGVPVQTVLARGSAADVLRRTASDVAPSCVVVGSRGLGPITQALLGSVAQRLLREADAPVIVVPSARDRVVWPA